jgi:hypothetical protein
LFLALSASAQDAGRLSAGIYDNMPTRYEDGGFIAVEKETHIGAAAGVGVDLTITPHLILNAQGLYQIVKNNHQGVFSIGVIYKF